MTLGTKSILTLALLAGGLFSQQVMAQQVESQPSQEVVRTAPAQVRTVQPTRSYRSYSVNPPRGEVRRNGQHSGDATWRHAGSKPVGHYGTGR
jgi:hypothetical protein